MKLSKYSAFTMKNGAIWSDNHNIELCSRKKYDEISPFCCATVEMTIMNRSLHCGRDNRLWSKIS